jgi:transcriptional regulator with XRE-family HTH domain
VTPIELRRLLAENVRDLAKEGNVSLNKLADMAGISRPTMHFLVMARSSVGVDTIAKLADALGQPPARLLADRKAALRPRQPRRPRRS